MANSNNFRSMFNDNFKILTWVLILFIAITPNFIFMKSANAASLGGWTLSNPIIQGASTLYNATKSGIENGVNIVKTSTAKITPSVSNVSKILRGGAYGYAISVAVEQILGFTVDWILDPANNQIKYYVDGQPQWFSQDTGQYYASRDAACQASMQYRFGRTFTITSYSNENDWHYCYFNNNGSTGYVTVQMKPTAQEERKIPLDAVSTQVISNAESHPDEQKKAGAQSATSAAAQDMLANDAATQSDVETQLNANAKTQTSEQATGNTKPNEANPEVTDISLSFPAFCGWAPSVCQAANVVINFPNTLTNWWDTATQAISNSYAEAEQFFKDESNPETDNSEVTIHQENNIIFDDSQRFNFSSSCPTPEQFSVSFFGATQELEFSYEPLCNFMNMIKPFVIAGSYVIGAYIVMGLSRGSAE